DCRASRPAVTECKLRFSHVSDVLRLPVLGKRERLCPFEGIECRTWFRGREIGASEHMIRERLCEGTARALRTFQTLAPVPQRVGGLLICIDMDKEGPARNLPLAKLPRPAQCDFEIRDSECQPTHLDLYPAPARARPDLQRDASAVEADGRIVTTNLERF